MIAIHSLDEPDCGMCGARSLEILSTQPITTGGEYRVRCLSCGMIQTVDYWDAVLLGLPGTIPLPQLRPRKGED